MNPVHNIEKQPADPHNEEFILQEEVMVEADGAICTYKLLQVY